MPSLSRLLPVAAVVLATAAASGATPRLPFRLAESPNPPEDLVAIRPATISYRMSGEFTREGDVIPAPLANLSFPGTLSVMRHQVTAGEFQHCVAARACTQPDREPLSVDRPMVRVNWRDADTYAAWLSRETGESYRLPTDQEWAYFAGSRFSDDDQLAASSASDPGARALASYARDTARRGSDDKQPKPIGFYGVNENGLLDLAGNVWEWTSTCYVRTSTLSKASRPTAIVNCGVRVVEGKHRGYITDFIRDPRSGGCSVGVPPSNLGFRLVRDNDPWRLHWVATYLPAKVPVGSSQYQAQISDPVKPKRSSP